MSRSRDSLLIKHKLSSCFISNEILSIRGEKLRQSVSH